MEEAFTAQITSNLGNVTCEAYDPIMLLEEKARDLRPDLKSLSTSCLAPAYVYLEDSKGARYLCDFHYAIDKAPRPKYNIVIDSLEEIKNTFGELPENSLGVNRDMKCFCGADSFVFMITHSDASKSHGVCNFHYRKLYYRFTSNGLQPPPPRDVLDFRKEMTMSIREELEGVLEL